MNKVLQLSLLLASIVVLVLVLYYVRKNKMNIKYSMIWIIWAIAMIIIAAFPRILMWFKDLIGIEVASNAVFLIAIFFLYCLTFYVYIRLSQHNEDILKLNYEIANLKRELADYKKIEKRASSSASRVKK